MARLLLQRGSDLLGLGDGLAKDEEIRLQTGLGHLTIQLLKAVAQTSIYQAGHPLAEQSIDDVIIAFDPLRSLIRELTYLASADETKPDLTIEGMFAAPVAVGTCIRGSMRDEFLGKLNDLFRRHRLVSLSFARGLDRAQMVAVLSALTQPISAGSAGGSRHDVSLQDRLIASGVTMVSAVAREEVLVAERPLPWRVKLALTRLRADLRKLPMYAGATTEQLQAIKVQLIEEIVRPLPAGTLLVELFLNCDIIRVVDPHVRNIDFEGDILGALSAVQLRALAAGLMRAIEELGGDSVEHDPARKKRATVLLKRCLAALSDFLDDDALPLFQHAVRNGLVLEADLPESAKLLLAIEDLTDRFMQRPHDYLRQLQQSSGAEYRQRAARLGLVARGLIGRMQYAWARLIVDALHAQIVDEQVLAPPERRVARVTLDSIMTKGTCAKLIGHTDTVPPEERSHLEHLVDLLRATSVPFLLRALAEEPADRRRRSVRALLVSLGGTVTASIVDALAARNQRPLFYRDLLVVLGELGQAAGYETAKKFLAHASTEVRQAALVALTQTGARQAEGELLAALDDQAVTVRAVAVVQLGKLGSAAPKFAEFVDDLLAGKMYPSLFGQLVALVQRRLSQIRLEYMQLLIAGCSALFALIDRKSTDSAAAAPKLLRILERERGIGQLRGNEEVMRERDRMLCRIADALAKIGSRAALPALRGLGGGASKELKASAARAIHDICAREPQESHVPWFRRLLRALHLIR